LHHLEVAPVRDGVLNTFLVAWPFGVVEEEGRFAADSAGLAAAAVPVVGVGPVDVDHANYHADCG
jgi:hypothetical protein